MKEITKFTNTELNIVISATDLNGQVWFVAKDVADSLGYSNPSKAYAFCKSLNILTSPDLDDLNKINNLHPSTKWCNEADVYRMIMRSKKPSAELIQDWVVEEVLPSLRKTGTYTVKGSKIKSDVDKLAGAVEIAARMLNFSESAKVTALATMIPELRPMLPNYVVDKSTASVAGSSDVSHSLSHLLKEHGVKLSAIQANKLLHSSGILTKHIRKLSKGDDKTFWAFTDDGLVYGKNVTNPASPRETQPLFFDKTFAELVDKFLV